MIFVFINCLSLSTLLALLLQLLLFLLFFFIVCTFAISAFIVCNVFSIVYVRVRHNVLFITFFSRA